MKKNTIYIISLLVSALSLKAQVPGEFDMNEAYPGGAVVLNAGQTLMSLQNVPSGTPIDSNEHWKAIDQLVPDMIPPGFDNFQPPFFEDLDLPPILEYPPVGPVDEDSEDTNNENEEGQNIPPLSAPDTTPEDPPHPDYVETIEALKKQLEAKDKELDKNKQELLKKSAEIEDISNKNTELKENIMKLDEKIENLDTELIDTKKENQNLTNQVSNLRQENQNISFELNTSNENLKEAIRVAETPFINGWVYDAVRGWMFTDAEHYPLIYTHNDQSWNFYELGSSSPRYFYSFATEKWEAWDQ
jgi:hypothetical protein